MRITATTDIDQLVADEPLSPETVLVLPPELRVLAIARLGPPSWPLPRPQIPEGAAERVPERLRAHVPQCVAEPVPERVAARVLEYLPGSAPAHVAEHVPEYPAGERVFDPPFLRSLGTIVAGRVVQLGLIFLAVTLVTLAMSVVAHAVR